jgi:hypothetical protein
MQPLPLRTLNDSPGPSADRELHTNGSTTTPGTPPRDYEWEAYQQDIDVDDDAWAKLPLDPQSAHDGVYEDEDEDWDVTEFNLQIGRMVLVDRVGAPLRPQYCEEVFILDSATFSSPFLFLFAKSFPAGEAPLKPSEAISVGYESYYHRVFCFVVFSKSSLSVTVSVSAFGASCFRDSKR